MVSDLMHVAGVGFGDLAHRRKAHTFPWNERLAETASVGMRPVLRGDLQNDNPRGESR